MRGIRASVTRMRFLRRMGLMMDAQIAVTIEFFTAEITLIFVARIVVELLNVAIQIPSPFILSRTERTSTPLFIRCFRINALITRRRVHLFWSSTTTIPRLPQFRDPKWFLFPKWARSVIPVLDGHEQSDDLHFQFIVQHFIVIVLGHDFCALLLHRDHEHISILLILSSLFRVFRVFVVDSWMHSVAMLPQISPRKELAVALTAFEWSFPAVFPPVMLLQLTLPSEPPSAATHRTLHRQAPTSPKMLQQPPSVQDLDAAEMAFVLFLNPNGFFIRPL